VHLPTDWSAAPARAPPSVDTGEEEDDGAKLPSLSTD
jgi:hypothetical protein